MTAIDKKKVIDDLISFNVDSDYFKKDSEIFLNKHKRLIIKLIKDRKIFGPIILIISEKIFLNLYLTKEGRLLYVNSAMKQFNNKANTEINISLLANIILEKENFEKNFYACFL